jgi:hypothetical protein
VIVGFLLKVSISILFYGADLIYHLYSILLSPKSRAAIISTRTVCNNVVKYTLNPPSDTKCPKAFHSNIMTTQHHAG